MKTLSVTALSWQLPRRCRHTAMSRACDTTSVVWRLCSAHGAAPGHRACVVDHGEVCRVRAPARSMRRGGAARAPGPRLPDVARGKIRQDLVAREWACLMLLRLHIVFECMRRTDAAGSRTIGLPQQALYSKEYDACLPRDRSELPSKMTRRRWRSHKYEGV